MAIIAYDESFRDNVLYVGFWVIKEGVIAEKILMVKGSPKNNWRPLLHSMMASSLKCFYDNPIRMSLQVSNLSWMGGWDGLWESDKAHVILDGTEGWKHLVENTEQGLRPARRYKKIITDEILYGFVRIESCAKQQQSEEKFRWVKEVDKWLRELKQIEFDKYFDVVGSVDGYHVYVKKPEIIGTLTVR